MEQGSQLARDLERIDLELEAADRALHGFAITARHDFINARMQRGGERILRLIDAGKHEEAQALMNTDNWGITDEQPDEAGKGKDQTVGKEQKGKKKRKSGYKKIKVRRAEDDTSKGA